MRQNPSFSLQWLLFGVIALKLAYVAVMAHGAGHLQQLDPDTWLHLARLRELFQGDGWYDTGIARDNTPFGTTTHWSRLFDALAMPFLWLGQWAMPLQESLLVLPLWWNTLVLLCLLLPLLMQLAYKEGQTPYAQGFVLLSVGLGIFYFSLYSPRQFDYHSLLAVACMALLACAYGLVTKAGREYALSMGVVAGFGTWLSVEFLFPVFLCMAWLGYRWLRDGELAALMRMSAAFWVVLGVAFLLEQPPSAWLRVEHDSLSIVQWGAVTLNMALLAILARFNHYLHSRGRRVLAAALLVALLLADLTALFPGFWRGPLSAMAEMLDGSYMWRIGEMRPLHENFGPALLAAAYMGMIALPWCIKRGLGKDDAANFYLLLAWVTGCMLLAMTFQTRWISYTVPLTTLLLALWLDACITRYRWTARQGRWAVLLLALAPLFFPVMEKPFRVGGGQPPFAPACHGAMEQAIRQDVIATFSATPQRLILPENYGTMALFFTPHSIVASNYHRNAAGIRDQERFFHAQAAEEARAVLAERGIDYLLFCPPQSEAAKARFPWLAQLASQAPPWLQAMPHPWEAKGLRIYRYTEAE